MNRLDPLCSPGAPAERGREVEVESGLLVCGHCGRWYPIDGGLPELLPDHLRDADRDAAVHARVKDIAPDLVRVLEDQRPVRGDGADPGAHYKKAEIAIKTKVEDPVFFGPGYSSPFNPWNSDFTLYLLSLFGTVAPLLALRRGEVVIDSGCGYAWTTEWLFRSGFDAIGVDICRTYLEIAVARMGPVRPHLLVCDVEHLPLKGDVGTSVLAYESFHHIPDRRQAMAEYHRVLANGGRVILAEPGSAHEGQQVAVEAMDKYGILEKGMELADVADYAAGTTFGPPEQIFVLSATNESLPGLLDRTFIEHHSVNESNLFRLVKGGRPMPRTGAARILSGLRVRARRVWSRGPAPASTAR